MAATALITGASGLLGAWTLRHWDVPGLHPVPVRSSDVDLLEVGAAADLVARTAPAVVIHLAWCASGQADYRSSPDNERWVAASVDLARDDDLDQVLALDEAFRRLEEKDRQAADVVRLRFFAGLSVEETATALELSERTVKREWAFARAWLYAALSDEAADGRNTS